MKKYNLSKIMKAAWEMFRMNSKVTEQFRRSFAECLKLSWKRAKEAAQEAMEAAKKGVRRMHYSEYKRDYSDCSTVEGSYDKRTKTIEVMAKVDRKSRVIKGLAASINGLCPICHTYCYGDCAFGR